MTSMYLVRYFKGEIMAKKGNREICASDNNDILLIYSPVKENGKVKVKTDKSAIYGGKDEKYPKGYTPPKKSRPPDIKQLEKEILQSIIGQDKQVREIITSIYRAIFFQKMKTNVLIVGNSGTGKSR